MNKIVKALFMEEVTEPELTGTELVEAKCNEILASAAVDSPEFKAAYAQLEKVRALKMTEQKVKRQPKIDPAIVAAGLGAGAQIACTAMIERYNANGHLFPSRNITANWLGLNGLWSKIGGLFGGGNRKKPE